MNAGLPGRMRDDGGWSTPYEPGRVVRAICWPFQFVGAVCRLLWRTHVRVWRFFHPLSDVYPNADRY